MSMACVGCARPMKFEKMGVPLEETFKRDGEPYRLWMSDVYKCPGCGHSIAFIASNQEPIAEHFQNDYASKKARYLPEITVPV